MVRPSTAFTQRTAAAATVARLSSVFSVHSGGIFGHRFALVAIDRPIDHELALLAWNAV